MFLCIGCINDKPSTVTCSELNAWIKDEENGLSISRNIDDLEYSLTFLPSALLVLRDGIQPENTNAWDSAMYSKNDIMCFLLRYRINSSNTDVLKYNLHSEQEYYSRSNYLSFGLDKDVWLEIDNRKINCALHQFVPHYGISPEAEVILTFPKQSTPFDSNIIVVLNDQLYGAGILKFEFESSVFNNIPTIQ
jgi:hypothetical protein